jgi:glutamate-1-semialdehyde 2,1-aminomutase
MAGGLAGLTRVFTPLEAVRINALGDRLRERLNAIARAHSARFQATGIGSLIGLHFNSNPILKPEDADYADKRCRRPSRIARTSLRPSTIFSPRMDR